jgi:hypothetical protein
MRHDAAVAERTHVEVSILWQKTTGSIFDVNTSTGRRFPNPCFVRPHGRNGGRLHPYSYKGQTRTLLFAKPERRFAQNFEHSTIIEVDESSQNM